jgi:hypothetical protein
MAAIQVIETCRRVAEAGAPLARAPVTVNIQLVEPPTLEAGD